MRQQSPKAVPKRTARSPRRFRFRAFYITVLCLSLLAVISLVAEQSARYRHGAQYGLAQRRALEQLDVNRLVKRDEECRLVHHAEDKCAFIKANCPDEEAGLFSYLSLYYCGLQKAQPLAFVILSLWLALLFTTIGIAASDFFCINLSTIASILGMSESMAGVTFLAFGNGSPDVFSTFAAMSSHSGSLAVGELIGAAGFITAVVAGSMALVREFKVGKKTFVRDVGFFIVAASFSMVFLADGALHLWECCVMVGFYVFYVVVVVVWHWYLGRKRRHREREAAARGQYFAMANEEIEVSEENDDDEDAPAGTARYRDTEDFAALERAASPAHLNDESDEDGDEGMHLAAEMASSMRVTRPAGSRRNTITPIRPSLVGALEFRSVLSSLQKARGSNARPIHLRRYSDDPTSGFVTQVDGTGVSQEHYTDIPDSELMPGSNGNDSSRLGPPTIRTRAVSLNDAASAKATDPAAFSVATIPHIGVVAATPTFPQNLQVPLPGSIHSSPSIQGRPPASPTFSISPPPSINESRDASPSPSQERSKRGTLAPPEEGFPGARHLRTDYFKDHEVERDSTHDSPKMRSRAAQRPRLQIPGSSSRESSHTRTLSPIIQFPAYTDSPAPMSAISSKAPSIMLPEPEMTSESVYGSHDMEFQERPIWWWPYRYLPSPRILGSTLFPTLYTWREKSIWDKFVGLISAPSIFLLAVTLPVVESETQDDEAEVATLDERTPSLPRRQSSVVPPLTPDSPSLENEPEWIRYRRATESHSYPPRSPQVQGYSGHSSAAVAVSAENLHHHSHLAPMHSKQSSISQLENPPSSPTLVSSQDWNRWLVAVQIFTAPLFVVIIVWANSAEGNTRLLVQLVLYSLVGSLIAFAILVLTTSPTKPPKYRFVLCFLGFVVAIAWISTIANEVVGVLKAIGVILGISDAILGLTIFAVGNSLGDLVADITVARLGYPVMALSACFGGPMLNILLGIGLSGIYMTIKGANHKHAKHPGKKIQYKPYEIEVSGTLMISAATLIITLVGLLIVVPLNKWVMSRRIGWGLIGLWSISTVVNLVVEVSGVFDTSRK
ncbi:Sodium/calcium exchanger protein-domain-containing protein [Rhexocercosporidium sp. MPI-PUGE-AT-0058]|nr:Sodium/calcium exchanger protein-domain-containing protein [Rhexocercosporidium sp. MPI-PUGE-AT-0058]